MDNLASLFVDERKAVKEQKIERLYAQVGKLTTQLAWIKKNLGLTRSKDEGLAMVERDNKDVPLRNMLKS